MNPRSIKVLVVGGDDKVSAWTLEGQLVHQWATGTGTYAYGIAIDPSDNAVCICDGDNHRILVYYRNM